MEDTIFLNEANNRLHQISDKELNSILRKYGFRSTKERYQILVQIYKEENLFSICDVYTGLDENNIDINMMTIYNTFKIFEKIGIIRKVPSIGIPLIYKLITHQDE